MPRSSPNEDAAMPLVRIDLIKGRTDQELRAIGEGVHRAMVGTIKVPELDRFQVLAEHDATRLAFDPTFLDIHRGPGIVFVQITLNAGRTTDMKRALYAAIVENLERDPGVRREDVLISLVEVTKENW